MKLMRNIIFVEQIDQFGYITANHVGHIC